MLLKTVHHYDIEPKSRFTEGQSVFLDYNKKRENDPSKIEGPYEISFVHFNGLSRIFMYQFKDKGFAVGEIYLKENKEDTKLTISDCIYSNDFDNHLDEMIDSAGKLEGTSCAYDGTHGINFFQPNPDFIKWIVKYADGRVILDIGCGTGRLTSYIHDQGGRIIGVDPMLDKEGVDKENMERIMCGKERIHFFCKKIQELGSMFQGQGKKVLLVFSRPSHGNYVLDALNMKDSTTEAIYITKPDVFDKFNDLGSFKLLATEIPHDGKSVEGEKVWSII